MGSILSSCCMKNPEGSVQPDMPGRRPVPDSLGHKDIKAFKKIDDIHKYYTFYNQLGEGSFGKVMKAEHCKASTDCAVKIIEKRRV